MPPLIYRMAEKISWGPHRIVGISIYMAPTKQSSLWKLDLLEVKFFDSNPRFANTKKLLGARNNSKLLKKLPASVNEARDEIEATKSEILSKKYYGAHKKLVKEVNKTASAAVLKMFETHPSDSQLLSSPDFIHLLVDSKLAKLITTAILTTKDLRIVPPSYIPDSLRQALIDKLSPSHPSKFFKDYCQENKHLNNYISSMWNRKEIKQLLNEIEWSFKLVRGNLTKAERDSRAKDIGTQSTQTEEQAESSDSDDNPNSSDRNLKISRLAHHQSQDYDSDSENLYDDLIGDSDDDEDEEEDDNTQEKPARKHKDDEDEFFEPEKRAKVDKTESSKKYNLPDMAMGYYSGGSDEESDYDADNDKVVKEVTKQRKNRRGQRARQKIWEQKFGKEAKHVKAELQRVHNEREQKRLEYEERCRKREEKARPSGSNVAPLGERKPRVEGIGESTGEKSGESVKEPPAADHPSWEAKRLANEKLKNVKFAGKKITFD